MTTLFDFSSGEITSQAEEQLPLSQPHEDQVELQLATVSHETSTHKIPPELFDIPVDAFVTSQE